MAKSRSRGRGGEATTRSDEELVVTTIEQQAGRVALRKEEVHERVVAGIPVRYEVAIVERVDVNEPVATSAAVRIAEQTVEVPLLEEHVGETRKTVVPRERVRAVKRRVAKRGHVATNLRSERLAVDQERVEP